MCRYCPDARNRRYFEFLSFEFSLVTYLYKKILEIFSRGFKKLESYWVWRNPNYLQKHFRMNMNNAIINYLAFYDALVDYQSFKCFEKKTKREIRVIDFGKWNIDGMARDEFQHDTKHIHLIL